MKYMLTLIGEEGGWEDATPEQMRAQMGRWDAYTESLRDAGAFVAGEGLQDSPTATTDPDPERRRASRHRRAVRRDQGAARRLLPARVRDLDEALEWAKKIPAAEPARSRSAR